MTESELRERIAMHGRSLYERGLVVGSSGNISARSGDCMLLSPTSSCLGRLDPERLSKISLAGRGADCNGGKLISGDRPTKEAVLHRAVYEESPEAQAAVHLHSTHTVALSCLADLDTENALPALTPPQVVYVGRLPVVPYRRPGTVDLAEAVRAFVKDHSAVLLANHGSLVWGTTLEAAVYAAEELEEAARIFLLLVAARAGGRELRPLTPEQVEELRAARAG